MNQQVKDIVLNQSKGLERGARIPWQRILLEIPAIAFIWLTVSRIKKIKKICETLVQDRWQYVLAAMLLQVIYYLDFTATSQAVIHALGIECRVQSGIESKRRHSKWNRSCSGMKFVKAGEI